MSEKKKPVQPVTPNREPSRPMDVQRLLDQIAAIVVRVQQEQPASKDTTA